MNQAGGTRDSLFRYAVPAGGVFVFQSDGFPPAAVTGWARLDPDPNTARPFAAGIFGLDQNGVRVTETGIPAQAPTTHARIFVDQSGNYDTGLALVSPAGSAISVKLKAFRCDGSTPTGTAAASVNIGGHSHTSQFVSQFMPGLPRHFKGMLDLSSDSPFVALTLRALITARGDFLLMTLPTADLSQTPPKPMIFPQIADGGGYSTEFILLSAGAPSTTVVGFFADDGTPLPAGK